MASYELTVPHGGLRSIQDAGAGKLQNTIIKENPHMKNRAILLLFLTMLFSANLFAKPVLRFAAGLGDNAVLQRDKKVQIRGFAEPNAEVTLSFSGQKKNAVADKKGEWTVVLDPIKASDKGSLLVVQAGGSQASLKNVVVGDVFLIARQTTIDISLGRDGFGKREAATAPGNPLLRVMIVKTIPAKLPQDELSPDATDGWKTVDKMQALKMSGAAFHVAVRLAKETDVPIGIIDLNLGHHFPIAWMSREALMETAQIFPNHGRNGAPKQMITHFDTATHAYESGELQKKFDEYHAKEVEKAERSKKPAPEKSPLGPHPLQDPRFPAAGYNAVLHPIRGLACKALLLQLGNDYPYVLYQRLVKEDMALERGRLGRAYKDTYDLRKWGIYLEPVTTPRLSRQWRKVLGDMNLPVGLITPPASDLETMATHHIEMRELQRQVSLKESGVGLILPGMKHIPFSAQPADEALLAGRALQWVLGSVYKKKGVEPSGPVLDRIEANYSTAKVLFKAGTAEGLRATNKALACFEVAGTDAVYSPAKAVIEKNSVKLSSNTVNRIVHVRYNWRAKPDEGLVNNAGLPALPFRTDDHEYPKVIGTSETGLPPEYTTPAKDWKGRDVTIINGALAPGNWSNGEGWLGATGILVAQFGPNMGVLHVLPKSPAHGKVVKGDMIYSINGDLIGADPLKQAAAALAKAESEEGKGLISFGLRRQGTNMDVALKLEVLGSYSSTSPYDCPKTDRLVANMEKYLAARGGVMKSHPVFQDCDALFLLAAGTTKYQGLVRRHVYKRLAWTDITKRIDPFQKRHPQSWGLAYDALLTSEYYLATGDRNVLPFLKWNLDYLAMQQSKVEPRETPWPSALAGQAGGWRHNWHGGQGYGALAAVGVPAYIAYQLATEIGVDADYRALDRGIKYLMHNGVEVGNVIYGSYPEPYTDPRPIDPDKLKDGMLSSHNGAIAMAGVFFKLRGDKKIAHTCSFISTYSFNNTHVAHGGNFWSNCFTGIGANVHGKKAFQTFMQGHAWYRDIHRMYDHGYHQGSAKIGGGQYLAMVAPRQRLRILGAGESVFAKHPKEVFRPALKAYRDRDYAEAEKLADALAAAGTLVGEDQKKAIQLRNAARELQLSIKHDVDNVMRLIEEGKVYEASLDLPQLKGVMPADSRNLATIVKKLEDPESVKAMEADKKRYEALQNELRLDISIPMADRQEEAQWTCLTPQSDYANRIREKLGKVPEAEASKWRMKRLESTTQAPKDWMLPGFDDSKWQETTLPMSWHVNHAVAFRSSFEIKDKSDIAALRLRMWTFRQQNIMVYINGTLVAKINKVANNATLNAPLNAGALKALKSGRNTIAVTFKNNWRWGRYTSRYETARANSVYNNGVTVMLDARNK